jgi:SARP family transcriptional regulator, regulator of embCAB operon
MHEIEILGHTAVHGPDRTVREPYFPGCKPRQVLELLALGRGSPVPKAMIAERMWDGLPPTTWRATLESYVGLLRRTLQPGVPGRQTIVRTVASGYLLDLARARIDLMQWEGLAADAAGATQDELALPLSERAVDAAEKPLLASEPYAAWAAQARRRHDGLVHAAAVRGATAALRLDEPARAVPLARRATRIEPMGELGQQLLIAALGRAGRRADAVQAFHAYRATLLGTLGVEPDPVTCASFERILRAQPAGSAADR